MVLAVPGQRAGENADFDQAAAEERQVSAGYDADLTTLVPLLCQAASAADGVLADPPPNVLLARFTSSDIILEVRFWSDSRRTDFVGTGSAVWHAIIAALKEAGVPLPDPAVRALVPRDAAAWRDVLGTPTLVGPD